MNNKIKFMHHANHEEFIYLDTDNIKKIKKCTRKNDISVIASAPFPIKRTCFKVYVKDLKGLKGYLLISNSDLLKLLNLLHKNISDNTIYYDEQNLRKKRNYFKENSNDKNWNWETGIQ